jgi:tetratricopeptide (TPR) repeat protein
MWLYQKALELAKLCGNNDLYCEVLLANAMAECWSGNYHTSQVHAREARKLSKLSANLLQLCVAHQIQAWCSRYLGNYKESTSHLHRAREIIKICGLSGGYRDWHLAVDQADIHLVKSEYIQAGVIYSQIVKSTSPEQNAEAYALSLLNIAHLDITMGNPGDAYKKIDEAAETFSSIHDPHGVTYCDMFRADMQLREGQFDMVQARFQEYLHLAWGTDHEGESFCLERLVNIKAWPMVGGQSKWPVIYLGSAHKSRDKLELYKALLFLGDDFKPSRVHATSWRSGKQPWKYLCGHCALEASPTIV